MTRRDSPENESRKAIDAKLQEMVNRNIPFGVYTIERMIYAEMDAPSSKLGITNYHKLRNYFIHKYSRQLDINERQGSE